MDEKDFWNWFLGFIEGEGSFIISIQKKRFSFKISITQYDPKFLHNLQKKLEEYGITSSISDIRLDISSKKSIDQILNKLVQLTWLSKKKESFDKFRYAFDLYYCSYPRNNPKILIAIISLKLSLNPVTQNKKRKSKEDLMKQIGLPNEVDIKDIDINNLKGEIYQ